MSEVLTQCRGEGMPTAQDVANEGRLARIEAKVDAFSLRFEEVFVSQVRDHGKRLRENEALIQELRSELAEIKGKRDGSKATVALIFSIVTGVSGFVGALISRML